MAAFFQWKFQINKFSLWTAAAELRAWSGPCNWPSKLNSCLSYTLVPTLFIKLCDQPESVGVKKALGVLMLDRHGCDQSVWRSAFVSCGDVSPPLFGQSPRCALRVWLKGPRSSGGLIIVCKETKLRPLSTPTPPPPPPPQLPHPNHSLEPSARGVRCHRPSTLSHMTLKSEKNAAY